MSPGAPRSGRPRRVSPFWAVVIALAAVWLVLDHGLPWLAMWVAVRDGPVPLPDAMRLGYLVLAVIGAAVYVSIGDESIRDFLRPVLAGLRGPDPAAPRARWLRAGRLAVLLLVPLLAGGFAYTRVAPRVQSPTVLRIQHPTLPGAYERLTNPFREPSLREAALAEGREIFQLNCRPCHGAAADGAGPLARGLRLKPASFTDPGTIATVVEAYAFWRATEGGAGLPPEATPWDSAMPAWRHDLTDEQRWKAVMAAYDLAGVEPRKPEKLGRVLDGLGAGSAWAQARPPATPERLERGRRVYAKRCQACHGERGDGQGPVAPYLDPRPRDFTTGAYKLRTTSSGEPPTDEDLFRVVTRGVPGTAMSGWGTLSTEERWLVIDYVKQLSAAFKETGTVVTPPRETVASPEALARGRDVYRQAKCWECHGEEGRGDGPSAATLKDDAGNAVRVTNLRKGWQLKGGREPRDIFMRVSTGLDGAPMPSYADALSGEERWALALYVRSLQTDEEPSAEVVLRAPRVAGELPVDPADTRWRGAPVLAVPLAGQAIARPRWQNPSVDAVSVRALHNGRAVAFLLAWDDPTKDVLHRPGTDPEPGGVSYPRLELDRARTEALRDAVRLQFPMARPVGPERPHFFLGGPGRPVALWHWRADADAAGGDAVVAERGEGWARPVAPLPVPEQTVRGLGAWRDGRWQVVMTRPLVPADQARDVTFEIGRLLPFAVQVWDGGHGEKGLMMSLSSWGLVVLESPTPRAVYVVPLLAALLVGLGEWGLVRRVRRRPAAPAR